MFSEKKVCDSHIRRYQLNEIMQLDRLTLPLNGRQEVAEPTTRLKGLRERSKFVTVCECGCVCLEVPNVVYIYIKLLIGANCYTNPRERNERYAWRFKSCGMGLLKDGYYCPILGHSIVAV